MLLLRPLRRPRVGVRRPHRYPRIASRRALGSLLLTQQSLFWLPHFSSRADHRGGRAPPLHPSRKAVLDRYNSPTCCREPDHRFLRLSECFRVAPLHAAAQLRMGRKSPENLHDRGWRAAKKNLTIPSSSSSASCSPPAHCRCRSSRNGPDMYSLTVSALSSWARRGGLYLSSRAAGPRPMASPCSSRRSPTSSERCCGRTSSSAGLARRCRCGTARASSTTSTPARSSAPATRLALESTRRRRATRHAGARTRS